jgi:hypothetical protein
MKRTKTPEIYDINEKRILPPYPSPITGDFMRNAHYKGNVRMDSVLIEGITAGSYSQELVRAQLPYVVTVLVYRSPMQLEADEREYYIYAPADLKSAGTEAMRYWKMWEGPTDPMTKYMNPEDVYPQVKHAIVPTPIDDEQFLEIWKYTKRLRHACFGHPDDPVAFTCLDSDAPRTFKLVDFQEGLQVTV